MHLYQQVNDIRSHAQWAAMKDIVLTPEQIVAYNKQHSAILEALVQRDPVRAVEEVRKHLGKARDDLERVGGV